MIDKNENLSNFEKNFNTNDYKKLLRVNNQNLIVYLFENDIEFNLTIRKDKMVTEPKMEQEVYDGFPELLFFTLKNYTFTTIEVNDNFLKFDVAFKNQDFPTTILIKLEDIFQITTLEDEILAVNLYAYYGTKKKPEERSRNAFLMNENNSKFF